MNEKVAYKNLLRSVIIQLGNLFLALNSQTLA